MVERIIKIVAVSIVTALAVIGLVFDFKTPGGSLNGWGQIALALIILSAITAIFLEAWQYRKERESERLSRAEEEAQRQALSDIKAGIRSIDQPLLPVEFFVTLRIPLGEDAIGEDSALPNFLASDTFRMMVENAPASDAEFRLQIPNGYVDVRDGRPVAAGVYSLSHPGLNAIHEDVQDTYIRLDWEDTQKAIRAGAISSVELCAPHSFKVAITFDGGGEADLELVGKTNGFQPVGLTIIDSTMFVSFVTSTGKVKFAEDKSWGFADLRSSSVSARLGYLLIHGFSGFSEERVRGIRLHDFQIIAGGEGRCIFAFSKDMLAGQAWRKSDLAIAEPSKAIELYVSQTISEDVYEKSSFIVS
jgi:hypothetical protein